MQPTRYQIVPTQVFTRKPEFSHLPIPARVSPYGAAPQPSNAYTLEQTGFSIRDNRNSTVSNYFFGRIITTQAEAEAAVAALESLNA